MQFVRVGEVLINLDLVTEIRNETDSVTVRYGESRTIFREEEEIAILLRFINAQSSLEEKLAEVRELAAYVEQEPDSPLLL